MDTIDLIEKAQQGDWAAYGELMQLHYRTVEKFAYQCGVRLDDIPDVTQEVFIKLHRFLHQFNQDRFTTWLYKITLNTARDYYRKEHRERDKQQKVSDHTTITALDSAETQVLLFEEDRELHMAILQLDEKYRLPLVLYYFQDLSYQQIADVLNISLSVVKTRLHRAKDGLKKAMDNNGGVRHGE